ncbi:MAG: hypothetical protein DI589_12860 [Shinella sp.]|nr:MAG: hypothetical protein DI589_12860 [Shinella sp.]
MTNFEVGSTYTRKQVADAIALPEALRVGDWLTGYRDWNGEVFIFANVGVAGRTGHNYLNRWDGNNLIWFSKGTAKIGQPKIDGIISNTIPIHLFWRGSDRAPFTYAGMPIALAANGGNPVQVIWGFEDGGPKAPIKVGAKGAPVWKRGPPPKVGKVQVTFEEGPTDVYLLRLSGPTDAVFDLPAGHSVIKVGMSGNVRRRLAELNAGFPPGIKLSWEEVRTRRFATPLEAFAFEGEQLENLRTDGSWIGGEYAVVSSDQLSVLLT